jgi:hypothetical protein
MALFIWAGFTRKVSVIGMPIRTSPRSPVVVDFMNLQIADIELRKAPIKAWPAIDGKSLTPPHLVDTFSSARSTKEHAPLIDGDFLMMTLPAPFKDGVTRIDLLVVWTKSGNLFVPWRLLGIA